jgi:hypothetical protein
MVTLAQASLISHGPAFAPAAGMPTSMNGDRRRWRHLIRSGAQLGGEQGASSFIFQNTNGVDFAFFLNRNANHDALAITLKRLTETTTIWPGDNAPSVTLAADAFTVGEEEGELVIGLRRTGESRGEVSVEFTTQNATAQSATDYSSVSGTLTFADDEITQTIRLPIVNNAIVDGDRTFLLLLENPIGTQIGLSTAVITIEDDDGLHTPPSIEIVAPDAAPIPATVTNLSVSVNAAQGSRPLQRIEYFAGPTWLGEENKPPYTFVWKRPGAGRYRLTARATDDRGVSATSAPRIVQIGAGATSGESGLLREFWLRRPSPALGSLKTYKHFPVRPTGWQLLASFETPSHWGDYYGSRVRGYLIPPETGDYTFWIAADDQAELSLSADESSENKQLIASVRTRTAPHQWDVSQLQQSAPIPLEAGRRYYIEALHKEITASDHLAVGWQLPGGELERPIPGARLAPFAMEPQAYLEGAAYNGAEFRFTLLVSSMREHVIETSPDLQTWLPLGTNTAPCFTWAFEDFDAGQFPQRFYRSRQR